MARTRGLSRDSRSASGPVPSVLPSSMIRTSYSVSTWSAAHTMSVTAASRLSTSLYAGRNTVTRRAAVISIRPRESGLHVHDPRAQGRPRLQDVEASLGDRHRVRVKCVLERLGY